MATTQAQGQGSGDSYWTGLVNEYPATVSVVKALARSARGKNSSKSRTIRGLIGAKVSSSPEGAEAEENLAFTLPLSRIIVVKQGEDEGLDEDYEMVEPTNAAGEKGPKNEGGGRRKKTGPEATRGGDRKAMPVTRLHAA